MKVSANQIQFLLKGNKDRAWMMVMQVRKYLGEPVNFEGDKGIIKNPSVDVKEFDKYHKLSIEAAILDIKNNSLTRSAFKKYLLFDYPEKKLGEKFKEGKVPKDTIRLPPILRSLMSPKDLQAVDDHWNKHFAGKKYLYFDTIKPTFKP